MTMLYTGGGSYIGGAVNSGAIDAGFRVPRRPDETAQYMMRGKVLFWALLASAVLQRAPAQAPKQDPADGPVQPLPFSHKTHVTGQGLFCAMCHPNPDPGETMTIAAPSLCMECHADVKKDSPNIQRLTEYAKSGKPVPWVRVYEIPDFVKFSHRAHLAKGNTCEECHGKVAERDRLYRESNLTMGGCVACHKAKGASQACDSCHDEML